MTKPQTQPRPYFTQYLDREPPHFPSLTERERVCWQFLAGMTVMFGAWYLHWRWTSSLNPDALVFSVIVALAETATFIGTCIFFYDIWDERDTPTSRWPKLKSKSSSCMDIDIFIATLDEGADILEPTIDAAQNLEIPDTARIHIWLLDDGNRKAIQNLAFEKGVGYFARGNNRGFKAGNLANALYQTRGEFVVICDADTQLFTSFLTNTIGFFRDPRIAWVQTPHWFFDIPEGEAWQDYLHRKLGHARPRVAKVLELLTARSTIGRDPFRSDPSIFFDIIQRRRNRNQASFCCGAASIHRRAALFANSLSEMKTIPQVAEQQPFKFHVSEDIYTSIQLHRNSWKSVYHPKVEARMLSPWSVEAWAAQKHKYAGGTFDIMLHANPLFSSKLSWKTKLHYLATFWSYAGIFWLPILLLAPAVALATGWAPIEAYTLTFFAHLLPVLICNELAIAVGTKGYDTFSGRCLAMGTVELQSRALIQVISGHRPKFAPTPKRPGQRTQWRYALPNTLLIATLLAAAFWGCVSTYLGSQAHSSSLLIVNLYWVACNILLLARTVSISLSMPAKTNLKSKAEVAL